MWLLGLLGAVYLYPSEPQASHCVTIKIRRPMRPFDQRTLSVHSMAGTDAENTYLFGWEGSSRVKVTSGQNEWFPGGSDSDMGREYDAQISMMRFEQTFSGMNKTGSPIRITGTRIPSLSQRKGRNILQIVTVLDIG